MKISKEILVWTAVWLVLVRFWIEVVTTTVLKNSAIIDGVNNNKVGYHHYQLGILIILTSLVVSRFLPKFKFQANLALGFGIALFLDQYTYILSLVGISLPFSYRSSTDYMIIGAFIIGLLLCWILKKQAKDQ